MWQQDAHFGFSLMAWSFLFFIFCGHYVFTIARADCFNVFFFFFLMFVLGDICAFYFNNVSSVPFWLFVGILGEFGALFPWKWPQRFKVISIERSERRKQGGK